jgi:hypothetical protein
MWGNEMFETQQDPGIRKFYRFYILKIQMYANLKMSVPFSEISSVCLKKAKSKNLLKISKMIQQVAFFKQRLAFFQQVVCMLFSSKLLVAATSMAKCHQRPYSP